MEYIGYLIDVVLHLDKYLVMVINYFGAFTYVILFVVIFCETGLVVTPFLPGDSLLFAAGALAALGDMNVLALFLVLAAAAILGDTVNYWIGHYIGAKMFNSNNRILKRLLKKEYLERTQAFYDKHGGKTILLARFIPIIRTFAPFVAGIGRMRYGYFITYNVTGGLLWTSLFVFVGYFFGNLEFVKTNFSLVIIAIILISISPAIIEYLRSKNKTNPATGTN